MPQNALSTTPSRREPTIDIIRGLWIVSMTSGHLAVGTVLNEAIHVEFVNGASGFILMSGLLLGMVQPGRIARGGVKGAVTLLLKRARLLYIAHVCSVLLAFAAGLVAVRVGWFPQVSDHGGFLGALTQILLLQVNPENIDILSLYVILVIFGAIAVPLINAGKVWIVAICSIALYAFGFAFPSVTTLPYGDGELSNFNWGTWQLLFLSALVVGWYWKSKGVSDLIESPRVIVATIGVVTITALGGTLFALMGVVPAVQSLAAGAFAKSDLGPGRFVLAWGVFVLLYVVIRRAKSRFSLQWLRPVETIGRRSLDSFLILTLVTILIPAVAGRVVEGPFTDIATVLTLLLMLAWITLRYGVDGAGRGLPRDRDVVKEVRGRRAERAAS